MKQTTTKAVSKTASTKNSERKTKPDFEQIQLRAFQIYQENGYRGNEMENWIKAEKELLKK